MSVGSLGPTIRLVITIGSLLDLFLAVIIPISHSANAQTSKSSSAILVVCYLLYTKSLHNAIFETRKTEHYAALLEEYCTALEQSALASTHIGKKKFGKRAARKVHKRGVWWRPMRLL